MLISVFSITQLHAQSIKTWKTTGLELTQYDFLALVEENHAFNYQLWHTEDRARRDDKGPQFVHDAKREIDAYNQARNDRMEAMDEWLFLKLQPEKPETCPVHSETPGMIIDRLSILALKAYHMKEQCLRDDVDDAHRNKCQTKFDIIQQQLTQLAQCLEALLEEIKTKHRTFKIYHQCKMYNDPTLNPELVQEKNEQALLTL